MRLKVEEKRISRKGAKTPRIKRIQARDKFGEFHQEKDFLDLGSRTGPKIIFVRVIRKFPKPRKAKKTKMTQKVIQSESTMEKQENLFPSKVINLVEPFDPESPLDRWHGQDKDQRFYMFHYANYGLTEAEKLFSLAEEISHSISLIEEEVSEFVEKREVEKYGEAEKLQNQGIARFDFYYGEEITVVASFWATDFYHYMKVELKELKPVAILK